MVSIVLKEELDIIEKSLSKKKISNEEANWLINKLVIKDREKNILQWGKYYFPEKFTKPFCKELHNYFIDIRHHDFTDTLAPRNHAKTVIKCFLIPIYQSIVEPHLFQHYLNIQNTTTKAISINITIRNEFEFNEKLRNDYGDLIDNKKWTEKQFVLKNGVVFTAIGAGESMRGLNYLNKRPDYIVGDDLYDDEDIHNLERLKKKKNWFWSSIYPARDQMKKTSIHLQGTAINKNDLLHENFGKEGITSRKFQSIIDYDKKITLWFDYDNLIRDKELMGSIQFEREMQNNCRDDSSSIIKEAWINFKKCDLVEKEGILYLNNEKVIKKIGNVDPAIGEKNVNDFTGKAYIIKTEYQNFYIYEIKNDHFSFNTNLDDIKNWHLRHKFDIFKIESISAFQAFGQEIRRTTDIPLKEIKTVKDKISRLEGVSSLFENNKVFINENIPIDLKNELVEQLINNEPNHDDIRDAVILGLEESKLLICEVF